MIIYSYSILLKPFERFGSLSDPVGTSTSTSYTLPSHLTTIARSWVCCRRKREYDRKDRRIVDRKPEENEKFFGQCISTLQSSTKLPALKVPGHPKSPTAHA